MVPLPGILGGFEPSLNAWKWHHPATKPFIDLLYIVETFFIFFIIYLFIIPTII